MTLRLLLAAAGAAAARAALAGLRAVPWSRTNFRGEQVSLAAGPALALAGSLTAAAGARTPYAATAALAAGIGAGTVGLYDDLVGARPEHKAKGFHGHVAALRSGRVTSGMVKIVGIGAAGLVAASLLPRRSWSSSGVSPGVSRRKSMIAAGGGQRVSLGACQKLSSWPLPARRSAGRSRAH